MGFLDYSDEELIGLCQKGLEEAFMTLYYRYRRQVMNFATRMVGNYEDAADVFQETFRYIFTKINTYKSQAKFSTLVYKVARNHCIDILRKRSRTMKSLDMIDEKAESPAAPTQTILEKEEITENIKSEIQKLPEVHKEILILRYSQELSYQYICEVLGVPLGTVQSRLHSAILYLRERIGNREKEE